MTVTERNEPALSWRLAAYESRPLGLWEVSSLLAVLIIPSALWLGDLPWWLPVPQRLQVWIWGGAFTLQTLLLSGAAHRRNGVGLVAALVIGAFCWGTGLATMLWQTGVETSSKVALSSAIGGTALTLLPYLLGRWRARVGWVLAALTVTVTLILVRQEPERIVIERSRTVRLATALHGIDVTRIVGALDTSAITGGALEPYRDGFLVLAGDGTFWEAKWTDDRARFVSRRIPLVAPLERERFLREQRGAPRLLRLRATDFVFDSTGDALRVVVSHQHWDSARKCFSMRVSTAELPAADAAAETGNWTTLYDSSPCIPASEGFEDIETGGRLAWTADGALLLTIGDHGIKGLFGDGMLSQEPRSPYGKIIRIERDGRHRVFTSGHRNPQGLIRARDGRIWSTEHGPQGGDEINVIVDGRNYGWPLTSYGTQYGLEFWPLGDQGRDHGRFEEPALALLPSLGISNLIQLGGRQFARWDGDFLVGSLRGRTILRVRTRGDRILYSEVIAIGAQVRDLAESRDGRIVIYNGISDLVIVERADASEGERAYAPCASCHGIGLNGTVNAPSLRHVFDRTIGSRRGFEYSPALKGLGGRWDDERLDAFLRDPSSYAPGTTMQFPGITDPNARRALIAYLHQNL